MVNPKRPICDTNPCPPECENVFSMVHVSYLIRGGTRVMWEIDKDFNDTLPWSFQLQVGRYGDGTDDNAWTNVGISVDDSCYAIDGEKRNYGKLQNTYYRVMMATPNGLYYSRPASIQGILTHRDWRLSREIIRKERIRNRYVAQDGYLLKRRLNGPDCNTCLDLQTKEVTDINCPECWGTGKQCGYYYPVSCIWADLSPTSHSMQLDGQRGTTLDIVNSARMLMLPIIDEYDVWVSKKTDIRYAIRGIQHAAEMRGVPLIANATLKPLPFSDVIYDVEIPYQDQWLSETC